MNDFIGVSLHSVYLIPLLLLEQLVYKKSLVFVQSVSSVIQSNVHAFMYVIFVSQCNFFLFVLLECMI